MVDPVIAIGVGFFIVMCMLVKFTGINNIPDIVDNTNDAYDDILKVSELNNQYKLLNFDDVSTNCIDVNIDNDNIIKHDVIINNNDVTSDDDIQLLMHLIEPIEDNIKQVSENNDDIFPEIFRILNFRAIHEKEIDLSDATLISLKSIKQ